VVGITGDGWDESGLSSKVHESAIIADGKVSRALEVPKHLLACLPVAHCIPVAEACEVDDVVDVGLNLKSEVEEHSNGLVVGEA
jgi:hypothetical protein